MGLGTLVGMGSEEFPFLVPAKAQLICLDNDKLSFRTGDTGFQFNPTSLSLTRAIGVKGDGDKGDAYAGMDLQSGSNDQLSFSVLLDATEDATADLAAAGQAMHKLYQLTLPVQADKDEPRHPVVAFQWGNGFKFQGVVTKVNFKATMFDATGKFKRVEADVEMQGRAFQDILTDVKAFLAKRVEPKKPTAGKGVDTAAFKEREKSMAKLFGY